MTYCSGALTAGVSVCNTAKPRSTRFAPRNDRDIIRLVEKNPLAWISISDAAGPFASAVPIRPVIENEKLSGLVGHIPRESRIAKCLAQTHQALIIMLGPHGYISPSCMSDRSQAPTWNYTSVQIVADIRIRDEQTFLEDHLRDLSEALEHGNTDPWSIDEMGVRLQKLSARIVAIEATIKHLESRFKLGQDESDATYSEIVEELANSGSKNLLTWMRAFNPNRG